MNRFFAASMSVAESLQDRIYGPHREHLLCELLSLDEGSHVLEIGPGTGVNFPYLPDGITWHGMEPNEKMLPYIYEKVKERNIIVDLHTEPAETLPLDDDSVDAALSTLVLCSVDDPAQVLREIHRVLKPGAPFYFIEHVAAPPNTWLRSTQRAIRPCWKCLGDGCRTDRETAPFIQNEFDSTDITSFRISVPLPITPHIKGVARA